MTATAATPNDGLPVVDLALLDGAPAARRRLAQAIDTACRGTGFFYVVGHGVPDELPTRVAALAGAFFALKDAEKEQIAMRRGGRAWRGWFPLRGELTSGTPDDKEGLYFGAELDPSHPKVRAGAPLHGANLFPARPSGLRNAVLAHIDAMTRVGHRLASAVALALGLPEVARVFPDLVRATGLTP
jgi:isopenicillin N synthase-like dioxygenase